MAKLEKMPDFKGKNHHIWIDPETKLYTIRNVYVGKDPKTGKSLTTTRRNIAQGILSVRKIRDDLKREYWANRNRASKSSPKTFEQVSDEWYQVYAESVTGNTERLVEGYFRNYINPRIGKMLFDRIDKNDIRDLRKYLSTQLVNWNKVLNYVHRVFLWALENEMIDSDPFVGIGKGPKKPQRHKVADEKHWNVEELESFLDACKTEFYDSANRHFYEIFLLYALTGMRRNEPLALKRADLHLDSEKGYWIRVDEALTRDEHGRAYIGDTKNAGANRIVAIGEKLAVELQDFMNWQDKVWFPSFGIRPLPDDQQLLFPNRRNHPITESTPIKKEPIVIEKYHLGIPTIGIHGFRYTYATLAMNGTNPLTPGETQHQLGHKTAEFTMEVYASITAEQQNAAGQKFENRIDF